MPSVFCSLGAEGRLDGLLFFFAQAAAAESTGSWTEAPGSRPIAAHRPLADGNAEDRRRRHWLDCHQRHTGALGPDGRR